MQHNPTTIMPESVDELKKLGPQERIKRLKELEEERKHEIEEAEELIKETVREIAEAEEKKRIPIPQARATDLSSTLTTAEEKELVATHHFTTAVTATTATTTTTAAGAAGAAAPATPQSSQQQRSLEEVATEEGLVAQQQAQQQPQQFQRPVYDVGTQQQKSAFGEYIRASQQTATSSGAPHETSREASQLEKITEFYKERTVTGTESGEPQQKYFGTHEQVTGSYEMRKREQEDKKEQSDFYRKRGGPA